MTRSEFIELVLKTLIGDCIAGSKLLHWGCKLLPDDEIDPKKELEKIGE